MSRRSRQTKHPFLTGHTCIGLDQVNGIFHSQHPCLQNDLTDHLTDGMTKTTQQMV
jgi:hypothetical protein